jgi:hypothetical protein
MNWKAVTSEDGTAADYHTRNHFSMAIVTMVRTTTHATSGRERTSKVRTSPDTVAVLSTKTI